MLMITTIHFEGGYVNWKSQMRFVNQTNTINIENSKIEVLLELFSRKLSSREDIQNVLSNH